LDLLRALGATRVVDHVVDDHTRTDRRYDRILDMVGARSIFASRGALTPDGVYLIVGGSVPRMLQAVVVGGLISRFSMRSMGMLAAKPNREDLAAVADMAAFGVISPVIEARYPLPEVPEALRRLGAGELLGKTVVSFE
jgi:NADPH:quinone reductase-like Zn-dependent oxidoreductase